MRAHGFTLVELLIAMVIAAILLMLALPTYTEFMRNSRIRGIADSLANGIRLAQAEAIRRNQNVEFVVTPATGWSVRDPLGPAILHNEPFVEGGGQVVVTPSPAATVKLTYSGIGQFITPLNPDDMSAVMTSLAVSHATVASRELRVIAQPWGQGIRVCDNDPTVDATLRCPVGVP